MRQIKASEVKPGMTIRWDDGCGVQVITPSKVGPLDMHTPPATILEGDCGVWRATDSDRLVTVLAEPQPEEPTEFGAKVIVGGRRFLRADGHVRPWLESEAWTWYTWAHLCSLGPVQVVPNQGWTVPADAPEVPDHIEKWPEYDKHLKDHKWRDAIGDIWSSWNGKWGYQVNGEGWRPPLFETRPFDGPWTRVTD